MTEPPFFWCLNLAGVNRPIAAPPTIKRFRTYRAGSMEWVGPDPRAGTGLAKFLSLSQR